MYQQLTFEDIKKNKTLSKIWDLVCHAHKGQTRNGTDKNGDKIAYTHHLFKTMEITANALGKPTLVLQNDKLLPFLIVALTHDTIEDTHLNSKEKLSSALTPIVGTYRSIQLAYIVSELSNPAEGFSGTTKEQQDLAKKRWQTEHAKTMSIPAKIIKMADQIANTIDCSDLQMHAQTNINTDIWPDDRKLSYAKKALAVSEACMENTEHASAVQKNVLSFLLKLQRQAYDYTTHKIMNKYNNGTTFFEQLDTASISKNEPVHILSQHIIKPNMSASNTQRTQH